MTGKTVVPMIRMALMFAAVSLAAAAAAAPVPTKMRGVWGKDGRCDLLSKRLTITAHRAG